MNRLDDFLPTYFGNDFQPLAGGSIHIYADESETAPLPLYSRPPSETGTDTGIENPQGLNSAGQTCTPVYFEENGAFVVVRDRNGLKVKTFTHVSDSIGGSISIKGDVKATRNVEAGEQLISKILQVNGGATVVGKLTAGSVMTNSLKVNVDAEVDGKLSADSLAVSGNAEIKGSLNVNKIPTVNTDTIKSNQIINQNKITTANLEVTGGANFLGNLATNLGIIAIAANSDGAEKVPPVGSCILGTYEEIVLNTATISTTPKLNDACYIQNALNSSSSSYILSATQNANGSGKWRISGLIRNGNDSTNQGYTIYKYICLARRVS